MIICSSHEFEFVHKLRKSITRWRLSFGQDFYLFFCWNSSEAIPDTQKQFENASLFQINVGPS